METISREQLVFPQLGEKLLAFYGSCRFIIIFTTAHLFSVSWALTQSTPSHSISRSILILSSHQLLGLLSGLFPSDFPTTMLYIHFISPHACDMPHLSHPLGHLSDILWVHIMVLFIMQFSPVSFYFLLIRPFISSSAPFLNISCLYYSLNVINQVSHPYKTKRQGLLSTTELHIWVVGSFSLT